jgi:hypothetical protein
MAKLKYNVDKDTYSLKGMSYTELTLIRSYLYHTRLGRGDIYREAAFSLLQTFDKSEAAYEPDLEQVSIGFDTSDWDLAIVVSEAFADTTEAESCPMCECD